MAMAAKLLLPSGALVNLLLLLLIAPVASAQQLVRGASDKTTTSYTRDLEETSVSKSWPTCYADISKNCDGVDFTLPSTPSMWHSKLSDGSFVDTKWERVGLGGSTAKFTNFTNANMRYASVNHAQFDYATFKNADLTGTNFDSSCFRGVDFTSATITDDTRILGASFDVATIFPDGNTWLTTNFFNHGPDFKGMRILLDGQDISGQDMVSMYTSYVASSFNRMKAHGSSFVGADLSRAQMWAIQAEDSNFAGCNLLNVPLHYSNLRRVDLSNASLQGTGLKHSNLHGCNLIGADLTYSDFDGTTVFVGCTFDSSSTKFPVDFDPLSRGLIDVGGPVLPTWPGCYDDVPKNCDTVDFTWVQESLWHATLTDASFVGSNWEGVGFGGSTARNSNFTGAILRSSSANHVNFQNSCLRGVDLSGTNLDNANFKGADLTFATYDATTVFTNVAFDPYTVFFDGLGWASTAFFDTGDLKGMRLIMDNQDATGMDFGVLFPSYIKSSFNSLQAQDASFRGCDLTQASMWSFQGVKVDFSNAILANVPLHYSRLTGANFSNAILSGTGLLHSNLAGCNLVGADLSTANFDSTTTMTDCLFDDTTLFPSGFDPINFGLKDINAPTPSPSQSPTTSSPTPAPTPPSLEDLMSNTLFFGDIPCFPMGINLASVVYYSNQWTFKNAFLESGGCCWPYDAKVDTDGNLLEAAPADYPDYWKAGRNLIYRVDGEYPGGTYILRASGNGTISLAFDVGPTQYVTTPTGPNGHAVNVAPSSSGVQLTIEETTATDPVRDISFTFQEYEESNSTSPFTPTFMDTLSGMNVLRFMDMGRTNNNNIVNWNDRNDYTSVSQSRTTRRAWEISSIQLPPETRPFTGVFGLEFSTTEPHGLSSGQAVDIDNLVGEVTVSRQGGTDFIRDLSDVWFPRIVEVTGPNTFLVDIGNWDWNRETYSLSAVSATAAAERVILEILPGVAYEYMIEMSKEAGADPWFCVPHLASDDYVRNMAELIANSGLGPDKTVYVELSNEVWNTIFTQSSWAEANRRELGLSYSSQFYGKRSKQVFDIFEDVFSTVPGAPLLNRVLATMSVNTWISEQVILGAGGAGSFDSLAVAPYFSAKAQDVFALSTDGQSVNGVTVTDVLQLCLEDIFGDNRRHIAAQNNMAKQYGARLIAYEGGQHLGGQGNSPLGGRLENDLEFQDLMIAANRDPRMHNLYQAYFKQWAEIVGGNGVFAHFSFIGQPSKWGSWGVKETYSHADTVEESPKWASVKGIADACR